MNAANLMPIYILLFLCFSCGDTNLNNKDVTNEVNKVDEPVNIPLFSKLTTESTGLNFVNHNKESNDFNYYSYEYFYNGGGVAVLDINNDGLQDICFTANMAPNQMFLNKGNLQFEDISNQANVNSGTIDWTTGVSVVDINNDGFQDLYICRSGWFEGADKSKLKNLLFVNNGDLTFTESAADYGLDGESHSTQACFFDYDNDGDQDMYLLNHPKNFLRFGMTGIGQFLVGSEDIQPESTDRFFENNNGKFVDKTKAYGLENFAHGLGVIASDIDRDGFLDLYIGNDYAKPDYLLMNQKGKGFKNILPTAMQHIPKFSMGVDASDINNDGWQDLFSVEMLAEDNYRKKTNMASMNPALYENFIKNGLHYQDMHNCMQLNNGNNTFSEIAWMSGIAETDWSWSPLFADYDNDGWSDLYVANGYKRDVIDKDASKNTKFMEDDPSQFSNYQATIPATKIANYAFRNNKDLTFTKVAQEWGLADKVNSNGAAYADFDNDGDIDLVVNNLEEVATFYKNNGNENNYLSFVLKNGKTNAFGASVEILDNDVKQRKELIPLHGYQSASETKLHFGVAEKSIIDSIKIDWFDGSISYLTDVETNQAFILNKQEQTTVAKVNPKQAEPLFRSNTSSVKGTYTYQEQEFDDYEREVLLPHKLSEEGPKIAVGDVNGDGVDDFFVGNSSGYSGSLFVYQNGSYSAQNNTVFRQDKSAEDIGAHFFDFDGDEDLDLYVVSGSNEFDLSDPSLQDRLYENDGSGNFTLTQNVLPKMEASGSCVVSNDFDDDGDLDLFIGGFQVPGKYPLAGTSYLLENDNGSFIDATLKLGKELQNTGMVKDAKWADITGNGKEELVVVGHWMPIKIYANESGSFVDISESLGSSSYVGWWNAVEVEDIDGDGNLDIVAGNLGLNSKNKATPTEPFHVYADDFDGNGTNDIVLGYYNNGVCYPVRGRQCTSEQVPTIASKIPTYKEFGMANLEQVYGKDALDQSAHYEATTFAHAVFYNNGSSLTRQELPMLSQASVVNAIVLKDVTGDGKVDVLMAGNQFPVEIETGKYDASYGEFLVNQDGQLNRLSNLQTGLMIKGEVKAMEAIEVNGNLKLITIVSNKELLLIDISTDIPLYLGLK